MVITVNSTGGSTFQTIAHKPVRIANAIHWREYTPNGYALDVSWRPETGQYFVRERAF